MSRRAWLRSVAGAGLGFVAARPSAASNDVDFAPVVPGRALVFPADFGAHPAFRTEWWYITGWLRPKDASRSADTGRDESGGIGVQVTFFRRRTTHPPANPSRFAPTQLVLAHAALALPSRGRLLHDQALARAGTAGVGARTGDTDVTMPRWRLHRDTNDRYHAVIDAREFSLALRFAPPGPPILQGERGFSRKGPRPEQASWYYSRPQLAVDGTIEVAGDAADRSTPRRRIAVGGLAWMDHEWSSEILDRQAAGWDWVGLNLDDGSALMAFRIRSLDGRTIWSHARLIDAATIRGDTRAGSARGAGTAPAPGADQPSFEALRHWESPASGARYPVAMRLTVGQRTVELEPLFDDQELDARASSGTIYWEGAVRVLERGAPVGRGYLELTGYWQRMRL